MPPLGAGKWRGKVAASRPPVNRPHSPETLATQGETGSGGDRGRGRGGEPLPRGRRRDRGPAVTGGEARGRRHGLPCARPGSHPVHSEEVAMPTLAGEEIVTVVDDENRPVAALPRRRVRRENLPHRATFVFVFDRKGRVLVQRRTAIKDLYPGRYDLAAGGVGRGRRVVRGVREARGGRGARHPRRGPRAEARLLLRGRARPLLRPGVHLRARRSVHAPARGGGERGLPRRGRDCGRAHRAPHPRYPARFRAACRARPRPPAPG